MRRAEPKSPLSPFIFFSQDQRKKIKKEHSTWSTKFIKKHLLKTWRELTVEEIKKYKNMSAMDKARYDRQVKIMKQGMKSIQVCQCDIMRQELSISNETI